MENKNKTPYHPMWERPKHHKSALRKTHQVHWIELFYDLIHVVAIYILGSYLTDNLNLEGFIIFTLLFIAIWVSWGDYVFYNSLYVSKDYKHRISSAFHITTVMIMAASIPSITSGGLPYFIAAYGVNRIMTSFLYLRARKYNVFSQTLASEMFRNFFIIGLIIISAAFMPATYAIITLVLSIIIIQLSYILPKVGVMRFENFVPRLEHLSERFSLLLLISLGEGFFKMVLGLVDLGVSTISIDIFISYILGGVSLFLLAWMYFDFIGMRPIKDSRKRSMMKWWYAHLALMFFAVLIAVALKGQVKVSFLETYQIELALLGCLGFIGYLLSLEIIQNTVNKIEAKKFASFNVKLIGIIFAGLTLLGVYLEIPSIITKVLFFIAIVTQLLLPITKAYFHFKDDIAIMHKEQKLKEFKEE